jgi:hypothetical protein
MRIERSCRSRLPRSAARCGEDRPRTARISTAAAGGIS